MGNVFTVTRALFKKLLILTPHMNVNSEYRVPDVIGRDFPDGVFLITLN